MKITLYIARQQSPFKNSGETTEQKLVLEADSPAELHQGIDEVFSADHATGLRELLGLKAIAQGGTSAIQQSVIAEDSSLGAVQQPHSHSVD